MPRLNNSRWMSGEAPEGRAYHDGLVSNRLFGSPDRPSLAHRRSGGLSARLRRKHGRGPRGGGTGRSIASSDAFLASAHYWVGLAILPLALFRLALRFTTGVPPSLTSGNPMLERLAEAAHWAFYVLLFAVPVTGFLAVYVDEGFGELHERAKPVLIVLIALHAGAALFHHFVLRDGVLRRIPVPGARR